MATNSRSTTRARCEDHTCSDERCSEGRLHDAYKQGRWAMYTTLFVVESSVRNRTGA